MNAWLFGTLVLIVLVCAVAVLVDKQLDRGHEIRWHERFYQPQLPARTRRVIDVDVSTGPRRPHRGEVLKYHRHLDGHAPGFRSSPRRSQV